MFKLQFYLLQVYLLRFFSHMTITCQSFQMCNPVKLMRALSDYLTATGRKGRKFPDLLAKTSSWSFWSWQQIAVVASALHERCWFANFSACSHNLFKIYQSVSWTENVVLKVRFCHSVGSRCLQINQCLLCKLQATIWILPKQLQGDLLYLSSSQAMSRHFSLMT